METIRARCPGCQKLYGVDPREIKDPQPEFICRKCGSKFYFEFPPKNASEEVPTFQKGNSAASAPATSAGATKSCPKCKSENPKTSISCLYCGIVFEKFGKKRDIGDKAVEASLSLKSEWDNLLANYEKLELHEKFITDSLAQKQLTFASAQYRKMLEANPSDTVALKMKDKIIGLATMTFIPPRREAPPPARMSFSVLFAILSFTAGIIGTFAPNLKWLQPVGFSLFLVFGGIIAYKYYKSENV